METGSVEKLARSRGLTFDVRAESQTQRGNLDIGFTVTQSRKDELWPAFRHQTVELLQLCRYFVVRSWSLH